VERLVARRFRNAAVPRAHKEARNPVPLTPEVLARARAHFADHCALCHGNDGRGKTTIGQSLYPKAPDMWLPDTQSLADGHLFYIIKNGVRLTGMPAWGQDTAEDGRATWELVHFICHLPKITPWQLAEMGALNPKSRQEFEEEDAIKRFLAGEDEKPPSPPGKQHQH
jgi:cytochrome c